LNKNYTHLTLIDNNNNGCQKYTIDSKKSYENINWEKNKSEFYQKQIIKMIFFQVANVNLYILEKKIKVYKW